ncbi:protein STICHEL-like 2 isoform X2 [Malania oleifera]|uniref:protein STICHEL-like 2 isoform X2 n=2 Tax=Malania oleifera TaxID=397392 RepID=UPI0025AE1A78|nr:protein STICHEL-like 2 isoform X2 [Malania oleifera]
MSSWTSKLQFRSMSDGRRHSVDIPISKALLALRRVRSLRDPTTNSLDKFYAPPDTLNWETNSNDGISLKFVNGCQEGCPDDNIHLGSKSIHTNGEREETVGSYELNDLSKADPKLISWENSDRVRNTGSTLMRTKQGEGSEYCGSNNGEMCGCKSFGERYCTDHRDKGWDLTCITPSSDRLEDVISCDIESFHVERMDHNRSKRKLKYKNQIKSSWAVGDVLSRVGSPCLSASDALLERSSHSSSLIANDRVDDDHSHLGCGIRCCWSRTPKFRQLNFPYDSEDRPLLSGEVDEIVLSRQRRGCKSINNEIIPCSDSPRTLSQKFMPRSFSELVGQSVVARSLLSAVSRGRITSFYLFHGPRGTGKTSASRIFAAALNCLSLEEHKPCGLCQQCVLFFSGRSGDVKEVDSMRINRMDRVRILMKNAASPPVSSRYKVFIIDECQLLRGETWATVLRNLECIPQHVVFVMITADLDKLPRSVVSRSQRYHFPKIKDADIASRLGKICVEECLDFDQVALDFIAAKCNGSLRDAEMMLDQLSLLGKRITISLAHELIGIVSDDELLDLLDLAMSSDTTNTVRRARELMRSRIDPMQLISQLANLIMDILAGKCQDGASEVRKKFFGRCTYLQKLSHALKVLSETEEQLRTSKNQTTWLTVALLQLNSVEGSFLDVNDSRVWLGTVSQRDGDFCCTSSTGKSSEHFTGACDENKLNQLGMQEDCKGTLESIWRRATEMCQSNSLKNFLRKQGKLSSVCVNQGLAIAELEFSQPDYVSRAEKSWKLIASSLQSVLNCNVEIRINLVPCASVGKFLKAKKSSFSFFGCSRRMLRKSSSLTECGINQSDCSDMASEKGMIKNKMIETCSSDRGSQILHVCYHRREVAATIRDGEGNALSTGAVFPPRLSRDDMMKVLSSQIDSFKEVGRDSGGQILYVQEPERQPNCFSRSVRFHKRLCSSERSKTVCLGTQPEDKIALSIPRKKPIDAYFCANNSYNFCGSSNTCTNSCSGDEDGPRDDSKVHCWSTPTFPLRKVRQSNHPGQRSHLVAWVLPCAAAK